jgi:hypothetical protein
MNLLIYQNVKVAVVPEILKFTEFIFSEILVSKCLSRAFMYKNESRMNHNKICTA